MQKFSFVSAALIIAAMLALMGCGNALHDLHQKDGPQHPAVTFEEATGSLVQRGSFKFAAKTSGVYGNRAEDVTWEFEVVSGNAPGAKFNTDTGELSLQLNDAPGAVLAVTARSVRRPEVTSTVEVTVEPFFILQGVDDGETVTVYFTDGRTMTGATMNEGVAFVEEDLPGGEWVIETVQAGASSTPVLVGRPSGSVVDTPVSLLFTGGSGIYTLEHRPADSGGFIPIGSYAEFQLIRTAAGGLTGSYKQEADLDLLGNKNGDDTFGEIGDEEWTAIGTNASKFTGTFDGDGKGITNLYIDESSIHQGLFGSADAGSTIRNVRILSGAVTGQSILGGVVGTSLGSITGCINNGTVTGTSGGHVGGVVGYLNGAASLMTGCINRGTVTGSSDNTGGVAGWSLGIIINCSNTGDVEGISKVGGVAGYNQGTITDCSNTGDVEGAGRVGGVAGFSSDTITGCSNTGSVTGTSSVGGVAGEISALVITSSNSGTVTGTGANNVGGVVGISNGTITNCSNTGAIMAINNRVGGVAGYNQGTVTACYNTGTVSISGSGSIIGGVVGYNYKSGGEAVTVTACYNTGTVSTSGSGSMIGGVVGYNYQSGAGDVTVTASYNTGAVVAAGATNVGGVAGNNNAGTISDCWWLDLSGAGLGSANTAVGADTGTFSATAFGGGGNWPDGTGDWADPNWGAMGGWNSTNYGRASTFPRLAWQ